MSPESIRMLEAVRSEKWIVYMESMQGLRGYLIELFRKSEVHTENFTGKERYGIDHMDIMADDIQGFFRGLLEKRAEGYIDRKPGINICQRYSMWIHDPDGNPIEVHE